MSLIESISRVSAKWLATKVPNTEYNTVEDQVEVYGYGFQVVYGALFKAFLLVSISYLLGVLVSSLIIMLTFSSLRIIAGGYHLKTYNKCITFSLIMFIVTAYIAAHTYLNWSMISIWSLLVLSIITGLYIIFRYVPRDTPTKPINNPEEIKKFKRWSMYYLLCWTVLMTIYVTLNMNLIAISSSFGLLLELFSISNLGIRSVYSKIDNI